MLSSKLTTMLCVIVLVSCTQLPKAPFRSKTYFSDKTIEQAIDSYKQKNYASALTQFRSSDLAGNKIAPRYLGLMYLNGEGVPKDEKVAFSQFQRAAQYGDVAGQYWLAYCYEYGIGTAKDLTSAKQYYVQSAQRADYSAAPALFALGRWYENGVNGVVDHNRAINYYQLAAATGYEYAQNKLKKLNPDN